MIRIRSSLLLALAASLTVAGGAAAQQPDTVPVPVPGLPTDTLALPDSLQVADSIAADTLPPPELPRLRVGPPSGWATSTWTFDRDALMALRDLTLLELLEEVPGVVPLRGGDYGAPEAAVALGMAGGRVRVFQDGYEVPALDGAVPDLAMIGLGGIEEVRVMRGPGELRIHLESMRAHDTRPFSLFEAGTGDTDTNFFRGTFVHPDVLGGILGFALERVDTRGPFRREPGHRFGSALTWGRAFGERFSLRAEGRRVDRDVRVDALPVGTERQDWLVRGRGLFLDGRLTTELFTGASSFETGQDEVGLVPVRRSRRQHGARGLFEVGPAWAAGTVRLHTGEDVPARSVELEGGATLDRVGGAYGRWSGESWAGEGRSLLEASAWTAPVAGLSAFAQLATGARGAADYPPYLPIPPNWEEGEPLPQPPPPNARASDGTTLRAGATFAWRGVAADGAWIRMEVDSLLPLGLVLDRLAPAAPGGTFTAVEGRLRLDIPFDGWTLNGFVQRWDAEARYLPRTVYQGSLDFHDVFLPSRNLELWGAIGVKGRDPMLVPTRAGAGEAGGEAGFVRVPFYQSWYVDVQVRILPVHVFVRWENFVLRPNLMDFPGRTLPVTRAVYGVKWILWN